MSLLLQNKLVFGRRLHLEPWFLVRQQQHPAATIRQLLRTAHFAKDEMKERPRPKSFEKLGTHYNRQLPNLLRRGSNTPSKTPLLSWHNNCFWTARCPEYLPT